MRTQDVNWLRKGSKEYSGFQFHRLPRNTKTIIDGWQTNAAHNNRIKL